MADDVEIPDMGDADLVHYLGLLEAIVAVLCIRLGANPETLVGRAIEDITEQTGMETMQTERIIRERWTGRDLTAGKLAAQALPATLTPETVRSQGITPATEPPAAPPPADSMVERLRRYKERRGLNADNVSGPEEPNPDGTENVSASTELESTAVTAEPSTT